MGSELDRGRDKFQVKLSACVFEVVRPLAQVRLECPVNDSENRHQASADSQAIATVGNSFDFDEFSKARAVLKEHGHVRDQCVCHLKTIFLLLPGSWERLKPRTHRACSGEL